MFVSYKNNGLKYFEIEGRVINTIKFYHDGQVVLSTRSGWIEDCSGVSSRDKGGLRLRHEVRRARLVNLTKGGHFYVPVAARDLYGKAKVDLYIDLTLGEYTVGIDQIKELYASTGSRTFYTVRPLTGVFTQFGDALETILIEVPGSVHTEQNAYGAALATIQDRLKALGVEVRGLDTVIKDDTLIDLILAARAARTALEEAQAAC